MGRPNPRQQCLQMPDEGTGIDASYATLDPKHESQESAKSCVYMTLGKLPTITVRAIPPPHPAPKNYW